MVYPISLGGGHPMVVRQNVYRHMVVDFAFMPLEPWFDQTWRPSELERLD